MWEGASVLVTGGTGSFGRRFARAALNLGVRRLAILSRDELKQSEMREEFANDSRLRFFLGDVRDQDRLIRAFDGVDTVIHAAAMKQVPAAEYNPFEAVKTNVLGAQNVVDAAIDRGVTRVLALSTDKACSPLNLYGATKLVSDKLFIAGNAYAGHSKTRFAVVRYGNVVGSRGSIVPLIRAKIAAGEPIPVTDLRMTRFWITLDQGVEFSLRCAERMTGGELFVPKIPSMRMSDLLDALAPGHPTLDIGIRPGEKLHEEMISADDSRRTVDMGDAYIVKPEMEWWVDGIGGQPVIEGFRYASDSNDQWLTADQLRAMVTGV